MNCVSKGGSLLEIHNLQTQAFVQAKLDQLHMETTSVWLGANDIQAEGSWTWVSGKYDYNTQVSGMDTLYKY
jgi:hypothetical protein